METSMEFPQKLKIKLPCDPVNLLLGIYSKKPKHIQKDLCTQMFIAILFIIAKIWKQPKYPLIDEQIKKMWYIYTTQYYYSVIKK